MKNDIGRDVRKFAAGLGILGLCAFSASAEVPGPDAPQVKNETSAAVQTPETVIQNWPERSRSTALALIAKYGEPDRFTGDDLVWSKNGPWQKTVVYRTAPQGFLHGQDVLEQSISYDVPDEKIPALKSFDSRINFDKATGELSSRAESESLNYLALNLADEIVTDKRTPDDARDFYRKTVKLSEAGKASPYTDGFVFPLKQDKSSMQNPDAEPTPIEEPYKSGTPDRATTPPYP
jgi:hypothetical protein